MNQPITYEDACSKCGQPATRVRKASSWICSVCKKPSQFKSHRGMNNRWTVVTTCCEAPFDLGNQHRFVTSCCGAPPVAIPVAKAVT